MIAGHPHTVRDSHVPLYMQGFPRLLGQDGADVPIDPSVFDPGSDLTPPIDFSPGQTDIPFFSPPVSPVDPSMFDPGSTLIAPPSLDSNTQTIANMYAGAVASGAIKPSQAASATTAAINAASGTAKAILGPGASPRVAVRPPGQAAPGSSIFSSQSMIKGVPDIALIGGGLLLVLAMGGKR